MTEISPRDASLLVLIGQINDPGTDLIKELSTEEAKEIGRAVVADASRRKDFSRDAWATAQEIKWWRQRSIEESGGGAAQDGSAGPPPPVSRAAGRMPAGAASRLASDAASRPAPSTASRLAPSAASRRAPSAASKPAARPGARKPGGARRRSGRAAR